jgi:[acyl-carrier-protein] S-malonyltransferase
VERLASIEFAPPRFPIAENVVGSLVDDPAELHALVARHVVSPVRWESCARSLADAGATVFIEAGPGEVLTKLAKRVVPGASAVAVGSPDAVRSVSDGAVDGGTAGL